MGVTSFYPRSETRPLFIASVQHISVLAFASEALCATIKFAKRPLMRYRKTFCYVR
jgi:hypothetical protein